MLDVLYDATAAIMQQHLNFRRGLVDVASMISRNSAGADGAGVALMHDDQVLLRVASSVLVEKADDVQYGLGEGPCLTAVAEKRAIIIGSLRGREQRWPRFAREIRQLGIGSALSLPLVVRQAVIGSVNIYSLREDAFLEADVVSGERFARPVAAAIQSARITQHLDQLAAQLFETLEVQALISAAIGFLRHREDLPTDAAKQRLDELAARDHQSVTDAAASVLGTRIVAPTDDATTST